MKLKSLLPFIIVILFAIPAGVFAHGTEEEHKQEVVANAFLTYGVVISACFSVLGIIVLITIKNRLKTVNAKKQEGKCKRDKLNRWLKISQWVSIISLLSLIVTGVFAILSNDINEGKYAILNNDQKEGKLSILNDDPNEGKMEFMHIHGLGITNDGSEVYVPAHDGLKVFKDGIWSNAEGEKHDYMGFSMVDDGFYSSGHPGPGSSLKNPFGVIKTTDMGKNLKMLDLYGEIDFHGMAVGYQSHAIYVLNPQENSRMDDNGLYYSTDDTKTWTKSKMDGLRGQISTLAVHPTNEAIVALGTIEGLFVSNDYGQSFEEISAFPTTAVSFSITGELFAGSVSDEITLSTFHIETNKETTLAIPSLSGGNAIGYIAVNPKNEKQVIFTTFEKDIFITNNLGEKWNQLVEKGEGINQKSYTEEE